MMKKLFAMLLMFMLCVGLVTAAQAADVVAEGTCGTGVTWKLDSDGVLTISGNGAIKDVTIGTKKPWNKYQSDITTVVIEDGITAIGNYAFYKCDKLTTVTIPDGITAIGKFAFYSCVKLTTVTIPSSVTTIGADAFRKCENLSTVTIPSSVETIGNNAFYGCTNLTTVTIPSSVTSIGKSAFKGCTNLSEFKYLGVTAPEVGTDAFANCDKLTTIYVPKNYSGNAFPEFSGSLTKELSSGSEEEPIITCTINVSANPAKGGTVTGAGEYKKGENVTVTATANPGYTFVNWTKKGTQVSTAATYSFTATASSDLVANFEKDPVVSVTIGSNTTKYSSLVEAFNAANGKTATITLLGDYDAATEASQPYMTSSSSVITFDLGGYTLSYTNLVEGSYTSRNPAFAGTVTVQNGTIEADNRYFALSAYASSACTMTIKGDVTISTTNEYCNAVGVIGNMTLIIEEGAQITSNNSDTYTGGAICVYEGGTVILNGGTVVNNGSAPAIRHFNNDNNTTVVINGGTVVNMKVANAYFNVNHTATVDGNAWYKLTNGISSEAAAVTYGTNTTTYDGNVYGLGDKNVTVSVQVNDGYTVESVKANNTIATQSGTDYTFAMPKALVTLTAEAGSVAPTVYSVTASANPAEGGTVSGAGEYEAGETVSLTATANEGYTFVNWTENGTQVSTDATISFTAAGNRDLVANFTKNTYTVTYNPGANGTGTETFDTKTEGETLTLKGAIFTRTGHKQTGWATTDGGEKAYDLNGSYTDDAPLELYPVWEAETYTVIWQNWDGTELEKDTNVSYGATPSYDGQTPTKAGDAQNTYTFAGWEPAVSAVTGDVTYKATFTSSTNTYTVIWQNWDGTELEKDENVPYGATPSYDGATPTKVGDAQNTYVFAGWEPAVSAVTGDVTYKATFTSSTNTYTVIWQNWDGTELEKDENVPYGATPSYDGATPTKAGDAQNTYTFAGWEPAVSAVTGDMTYKATFTSTAKTYIVTFDPNGGNGTMAPQEFTAGVAQNLTLNAFTREGFTFIGWNTAANGSGNSFADGASVTASGNATLYAQWQKNAAAVYTVTVSNDGNGTGTAVPSSGVTGTEVELTATPNSGYRFKKWQVVTGGVTVTDNKLMIGTANIEVKAIFELIPAATYTVTFDPNGGSGMMAPQTFTEGVAQNLTLNAFTREGFTFIDWNTMADGSGNSFADGASVTASSNATLYAQWKAVPAVTPLAITKQPTDQFVVEGQRAEFSVEATGDGLTYQWYINRNDGRGWRELDGAIGTAYVTSVTDLECDGFQYGCLIIDRYGNTLKSDVAVLHVSKVPVLPETGDSSTPMLWLAMSILSMAGILLLRKKVYSR